jgi:hypothetical protein
VETIFIRRQIAAPAAVVWRVLNAMSSHDTGMTAAVTEVLGGQPPTFLSFRLLRGAPVRRNVISVQLHRTALGSTEVVVHGAFQPSLAGAGGWGRRRVRHLLIELTQRLEDAVRAAEHPGDRHALAAQLTEIDGRGEDRGRGLRHVPCL